MATTVMVETSTGRVRPALNRWLVVVGAAVVLSVLQYLALHRISWWMGDAKVYFAAGRALLHGQGSIYSATLTGIGDSSPFNYPPFAALVLAPLSPLPLPLASVVLNTLNTVILIVILWRVLESLGVSAGRRRLWIAIGVAVLFLVTDPVGTDMQVGNIDLFVLVALLDLMSPPTARGKGIVVGLAAGMKITPAFFVLYFLVTRQFRAAVRAAVTFLATVVVGFVVMPGDAATFWTRVLWDPARVFPIPGFPGNQSLRGVVFRLLGQTHAANLVWLALAVLAVVGCLWLAARLHRQGRELAAVLVAAIGMLLVTPFTWTHHWVWVSPLLVMVVVRAARTRSPAAWTLAGVTAVAFSARFELMAMPKNVHTHFRDAVAASFAHLSAPAQLMSAAIVIVGCVLAATAQWWSLPEHRKLADLPVERRSEVV